MDIWIVGEQRQEGWTFLGAYSTEAEAEGAIQGKAYAFMFPWRLGEPMIEDYTEIPPGFRNSEACEARRRAQDEDRKRRIAEAAPETIRIIDAKIERGG